MLVHVAVRKDEPTPGYWNLCDVSYCQTRLGAPTAKWPIRDHTPTRRKEIERTNWTRCLMCILYDTESVGPRRPTEVQRRFGGTYCSHLQGRGESQQCIGRLRVLSDPQNGHRSARCHIPEHNSIYTRYWGDLRFCIFYVCSVLNSFYVSYVIYVSFFLFLPYFEEPRFRLFIL
jgi:hypothetical protein